MEGRVQQTQLQGAVEESCSWASEVARRPRRPVVKTLVALLEARVEMGWCTGDMCVCVLTVCVCMVV